MVDVYVYDTYGNGSTERWMKCGNCCPSVCLMDEKCLSSEASRGDKASLSLCSVSCVFNEVSEMIWASGDFKHSHRAESLVGHCFSQVKQRVAQVKRFISGCETKRRRYKLARKKFWFLENFERFKKKWNSGSLNEALLMDFKSKIFIYICLFL